MGEAWGRWSRDSNKEMERPHECRLDRQSVRFKRKHSPCGNLKHASVGMGEFPPNGESCHHKREEG